MIFKIKQRDVLLKSVTDFKDTEFIKVITGVRRCGKSTLMLLYKEHLLQNGVTEEQIVYLSFEDYALRELLNADVFFEYVQSKVVSSKKMYLLFDEIQLVNGWEKVINSFRVNFDADITVTGSNAQMLSGQLSTLLSGRYVQIKCYPFSFKEFVSVKGTDKDDYKKIPALYKEYLRYGGFPAVVLADESLKDSILSGIIDTIILNDIGYRGALREPELVEMVVTFMADNIGNIISATNISNTLGSNGFKITQPTVSKYIQLFGDAFLFYQAKRYDIRGKEYLRGQAKYFVVDLGLAHQILRKKTGNFGHELENLVYIELLRRGYTVDVARFEDKEIDFIAKRMNEFLYIQVALELPENNSRETDNLLKIPDNHKKMVITQRFENQSEIDGIPILNIYDWLLEETV
jgi:predicted AAA+ superfamily ATPase